MNKYNNHHLTTPTPGPCAYVKAIAYGAAVAGAVFLTVMIVNLIGG